MPDQRWTSSEPNSEDFLQILFRTSPDAALVTTTKDRTIRMVNDSFTRLTGFAAEEATGNTTTGLNLYVDPTEQERLYQIAEKQGKIENEVVEFRRKDGSLFRGMVNAVLFRLGEEAYIATHVRDLTRVLQQQRESKKKDEEFRRLFETMLQGVVYQNADGKIISANPAAERMLGLSHEELLTRSSFDLQWNIINEDGSPLSGSEHTTMVALRTKKPSGPRIMGVYNAVLKDYIWLSVSATPLFREGETEPYQVYVVMNDITAERKAQESYRLLFHKMLDGFALHEIICDTTGKPVDYRYLAINPAFEQMTGLNADDLIGRTVREALPDTEQYWIDTYGHVALTGEAITFQNYSAPLDKYFHVTAYRPAPMQFACSFSDITEQTRYQLEREATREQIDRLAHICDAAPGLIIVSDYTGTILYANEHTCRLHHYTKAEFSAMHIDDLVSAQTSEENKKRSEILQEQDELTFEVIHYTREKTPIPLLIYARRFQWDGEPAVLSIGTDMTQLQEAELTLKRSLEQNQRILDNLQDGFYQSKFDGTLLMLNPRMAEMYGFPSVEEMLRVNAKTLYFDVNDRVAMLEKLHADGKVTNYVCRGKRGDGSLVWVSMHVQYLKDAAGEIIGSEGLIRDITERQQMEQEIQLQHESLLASNEILKKRLEQSINAISMIGELRDVYTAGHQRRVRQLACEIGRRCGLSEEAISNLSYGALIHDIGKIKIASDILNKPGKITNLEYQILQTHAEYSYSIVREMDLPNEILTMIHQHHERLDGSGYPNQLAGDQIILESRILAVADVVEAMTSHRPYRPALGIDAALAEIESGRGVKYDAAIVDHCVSLFREHGFVFQADPDT